MYKTLIYVFCILLGIFAISGLNINNIFKTNKKVEAWVFTFMISVILGYLFGSFIIEFIEVSKIL